MIDRLAREAWRIENSRALVRAVCNRLPAVGIPIDTFAAFVFMLHPDYFGGLLRRCPQVAAPFDGESPFGTDTRSSPSSTTCMKTMRPNYVGMRPPFQDDTPNSITFTTSAPGGSRRRHLTFADRLLFYLARMTEVQAVNYLATVLLDTYVGRQSGHKVLRGKI